MKKISFGNKEYVKASDIAKKFRYTQDYVGQLCRGDKVDARLVGRVWYVNPESVTEYRKTKHATQKKIASPSPSATKSNTKSKVEPVIRPKTARNLPGTGLTRSNNGSADVRASYSSDAVSIIPILHNKAAAPKAAQRQGDLEQQSPKKVTIKIRRHSKKPTQYVAEKIPEITLKSRLIIADATEPDAADVQSKSRGRVAAVPEKAVNQLAPIHVERATMSVKELESEPIPLESQTLELDMRPHSSNPLIIFVLIVAAVVSCGLLLGLESYVEISEVGRQSGTTFEWTTLFQRVNEILR